MRVHQTLMFSTLMLVAATTAQAKAGQTSTTAATSTIASMQSDGTKFAVGGDNPIIGSGDVYRPYSSRTDSVTSDVAVDWTLNLLNSTTRKLWVSFSDPLPGSPADALPAQYVRARIESRGGVNGDAALNSLHVGDSTPLALMITFNTKNSSSLDYRISFIPAQQPGTDKLLATCVGADSTGACNHWTIDPPAGAGTKAVGRLLQLTWPKTGDAIKTPLGDYSFTLHFEITKP